MLPKGSAIGFISSAAGLGWEAAWDQVKEYLDTPDFDAASAWAIEHNWNDYFHSKQAVCGYVARQAYPMLKQGIRINAICPGPTDTPLAQANAEMWLGFGADYREDTGIEASTPLEQAYALVFLCSDAAVAISGQTLVSDVGYIASGVTESYPPAAAAAGFLLGRM
jgi:NAD(P)-dependent dehydrogenase (short-subunit alcohol dehydrogenase family)